MSAGTQIRAAVWLQSRDLVHLGGRRRLGPALICGYLAVSVLLIGGALAVHDVSRPVPVAGVFTPIWLLWALLPAIGAGGGSLESSASLAPYPAGTPMLLASSWFSALTDVQYLLPVPVLFAVCAADYGPAGLPAALAFVAGGSALGQLAGWLSVAGLRARRGQSLLLTAVAVAVLAAVVASRRSSGGPRRLGTIPPARWLVNAASAAQRGDVGAALGWWASLAGPVVLVLLAGPVLVRRATLARLAGPAATGRGAALAASLPRALAAATWRGIVRTRSWRATLLAVAAVPFLTTLLADRLSYRSLVAVAVVSAGATLAANTWAFEAGGVTILLSAPVSRGRLVAVRTAVLAAALAVTVGVATACAVIAGPLRGTPPDVGYAASVVLFGAVAGMRTSAATASPVDLDALRARPATLVAVLAFGARCLVGFVVLSGAWHIGPLGAAAATCGLAGYAGWALRGARRRLDDGAALLAAFATVR